MVVRYTAPPTQRQLRVSEQIRQGLSEVFLRGEIHDPFFEKHTVIVTEVRVSADLSVATAYINIPKEVESPGKVIDFLNEINKFIRHSISKRIHLKYSPQIRFMEDKAIDEGDKMEKLFKEMESKKRDD